VLADRHDRKLRREHEHCRIQFVDQHSWQDEEISQFNTLLE
jgi:hypothetical protein